jgi:hypothetical protein
MWCAAGLPARAAACANPCTPESSSACCAARAKLGLLFSCGASASARRCSSGKGSACSLAASNSPHSAANVSPRDPMPLHTHRPVASGPSAGRRLGVAQRTPAQLRTCPVSNFAASACAVCGNRVCSRLKVVPVVFGPCLGTRVVAFKAGPHDPGQAAGFAGQGHGGRQAAVAVDGKDGQGGGRAGLVPAPADLAAYGLQREFAAGFIRGGPARGYHSPPPARPARRGPVPGLAHPEPAIRPELWLRRLTAAFPRHCTPGVASQASTKAAGRTQPACACHSAGASGGRPHCASCAVSAGLDQSSGGIGPLRLPGLGPFARVFHRMLQHAGATPVAGVQQRIGLLQRGANAMARQARKQVVVGRDMRRQQPAGRPDAPAAGASAASSTSTCQPRRARLAATAAPARPAPITTQVEGARRSGKRLRFFGSQAGLKSPCRLSRLGGMPGTFLTTKPLCASASRTLRAIVQVAMRVPRRQQRATALKVCRSQMSGLRCGLKPSR